MKQFFKFILASFIGTVLTIIMMFLIVAGMITSIVKLSQEEQVKVDPHTVIQINWKTPIKDRSSENPFESFDFATMKSNKPSGLNDILSNIEKAKSDPNIDGLFLDMESIPAGMAITEEIRDKLVEFKESGKFIISYADSYDQKAYYFATVSDEIYMNPKGMILFKGLNTQLFFFKNLLNKLDVEIQVMRGPNNKYKSAVEPLLYDKMSEANREQYQELLNSIWGKIIASVSESRGISADDLNKYADELDATSAKKALELNFVDGLIYRDELIDKLKEKTSKTADDKLAVLTIGKYTNVKNSETNISKNKIAVVYALGSIGSGEGDSESIGSAKLSKAIRKARTDDNVKAIVMRVNSPGGSALASDVIRREVELAAKAKPFIVSMGDVAASGGYWISTNADYIFAQPTTITGSIGVFGIIPNFQGLMTNKIGITFDNVATNKNANFIDVMAPMSEFQEAKINTQIVDIYNDFISLVSETRKLTPEFVDSVARGRVWTGSDAITIGLIDEIGGLEDAIAFAAKKAELGTDFRIRNYPEEKEFFEQLMKELTGEAKIRIMGDELQEFKSYYNQIKDIQQMKGVQARLPFYYSIN